MEKKNKKYYYIYKIVLLKGSLAGKYYYGQHSTNSLQDNYAGSGSILKDYYKKYRRIEGVTYTKEILKFYNSPEELNRAEKILVGDLWKVDPNCLNQCAGGGNSVYQIITSEATREKQSAARKGKPSPRKGSHLSIEAREKLSKIQLGRKLSETTKQKMRESAKKNDHHITSDYKRQRCSEANKGCKNPSARAIVAYNYITKQLYIYDCIVNFVRDFPGFIASNITACCKGRNKRIKTFQFKYLFDYQLNGWFEDPSRVITKIIQTDLNGNVLGIYNNCRVASEITGIHKRTIERLLKTKQTSVKYKCKFEKCKR